MTDSEILTFSQSIPGFYSETELKNLLRLTRLLPPESIIVEVGVEFGRSASIFLQCPENCAELWLIDDRRYNAEEGRSAVFELVTRLRTGRTIIFESEMSSETAALQWGRNDATLAAAGKGRRLIDLIHIDGDHCRAGVETDIAVWKHKVRRPSGLMVFHDYDRKAPDKLTPIFPDYTDALNESLRREAELWKAVEVCDTQLVVKARHPR